MAPEFIRRNRGWLHLPTGRFLPLIAGAEEDPDPKPDPPADPKPADPKPADPKPDPKPEDQLGDAGKAAIAAERKTARDEKRRADAAEAKLREREEADASDLDKEKRRADDAEAKINTATEKLRKANLLTALGGAGLTGAKAKAAARLLDSVEYGDDDEPTNLQDALTAAKAEYGEEQFKGAKPTPPAKTNGGEGNDDRDGPSLTADELAAAKASGLTPEEYANYKSTRPKLPEKKTTS